MQPASCCATRLAAARCCQPAGDTIPDFAHVGCRGDADLVLRRTVVANGNVGDIATPPLGINTSESRTLANYLDVITQLPRSFSGKQLIILRSLKTWEILNHAFFPI